MGKGEREVLLRFGMEGRESPSFCCPPVHLSAPFRAARSKQVKNEKARPPRVTAVRRLFISAPFRAARSKQVKDAPSEVCSAHERGRTQRCAAPRSPELKLGRSPHTPRRTIKGNTAGPSPVRFPGRRGDSQLRRGARLSFFFSKSCIAPRGGYGRAPGRAVDAPGRAGGCRAAAATAAAAGRGVSPFAGGGVRRGGSF